MSALIKLKTLQGELDNVKGFSKPKIVYEQYETPAHIAAISLYTIQTQYEAIENKLVLDAGCGAGMLAVGASLLGAGNITAMEIDTDALGILDENINDMELTNIDPIQCDFLDPNLLRCKNYFDTVVMNPPFGTKNNLGVDMKFLQMGLQLSCENVFSLHKSSTRSHIQKKIKQWGVDGGVIAKLNYNLSATYHFHKENSRNIDVDLWRLHNLK